VPITAYAYIDCIPYIQFLGRKLQYRENLRRVTLTHWLSPHICRKTLHAVRSLLTY